MCVCLCVSFYLFFWSLQPRLSCRPLLRANESQPALPYRHPPSRNAPKARLSEALIFIFIAIFYGTLRSPVKGLPSTLPPPRFPSSIPHFGFACSPSQPSRSTATGRSVHGSRRHAKQRASVLFCWLPCGRLLLLLLLLSVSVSIISRVFLASLSASTRPR